MGKRFTLHAISGIRKVQWGSVAVDFAASLLGGLSLRAFTCSNPQSDLQSSQRLNVIYCQEDWDDFGVRLHATIASLFQLLDDQARISCPSRQSNQQAVALQAIPT